MESELITASLAEMLETGAILGQPGGVGEVLHRLAARARDLTAAEFAAIGIIDEAGDLDRFIHVGMDERVARRLSHPPTARGLLGTILRHERPLRLDDLTKHPDSAGWPEGHPEMCAFLGVPLQVAGRVIGSLYLTRTRGAEPFTAADELSASVLGLQIAGYVWAVLAHERNGRLTLLEERVRIAHDLHDGTIQSLYAVGLQLEDAATRAVEPVARETLSGGVESLNDVIRQMRSYISILEATEATPQPELARDLAFAVRQIVPPGIDTVVNIAAPASQDITARATEDLLYIVREALSNAVRHANPTKIAVDFRQTDDEAALTIQDNGVGYSRDAVRSGLGSITMRSRAEQLGAVLDVIAIPGMGTTIRVRMPRGADLD